MKAARSQDTGPTIAARHLVLARAGGCCELCGVLLHDGYGWVATHSFHHRQGRGMGGTSRPEANSPANLLLLCGTGTTGCHGFITRHPSSAEQEGWIVRHGTDPADVVVTIRDRRGGQDYTRRVLLTAAGEYQEAAA